MAADAMRAAKAAGSAAPAASADADAGQPPAGGPPDSFEALLRELVDEKTYPHLYRIAWDPAPDEQLTERAEFLWGVETILDGVQALIERAG
jgi:hypothetical protein